MPVSAVVELDTFPVESTQKLALEEVSACCIAHAVADAKQRGSEADVAFVRSLTI